MPVRTENGVKKAKELPENVPSRDLVSLNETAEHHALRKSGNARAVRESVIPKRLVLGIPKAKLERNTAEHERKQHHEDREIDRWNDDGESERKGCQQAEPAEHQPGLVPVPDRCDRIHDRVAGRGIRREAIEHADTEIEAVEHDVEEHRHPEDQRPDRDEVEDLVHTPSPPPTFPPARTGAWGRPASMGGPVSSATAGPLRTMRHMRTMPTGYINRYTAM